jgi:hypothetical protein
MALTAAGAKMLTTTTATASGAKMITAMISAAKMLRSLLKSLAL